MKPTTMREDLAFLRAIAEEGRGAVEIYGGYLILWGCLISAAYINQFLIERQPNPNYPLIGIGYLAMAVLGWIGTGLIGRLGAGRRGPRTLLGRVFATLFATSGVVMTVFAINATFSPTVPIDLSVIVAAQMMGLCFIVTGLLARLLWLVLVGVAWLIASIGLPHLMEQPGYYLASAVVWLALMVAPGAALVFRQYKKRQSNTIEGSA